MSTRTRVTGFVVGLVVLFGAACAGGRIFADDDGSGAEPEPSYSLAMSATTLRSGASVPVSFQVLGPDGRAVTGFDVRHEKKLHLIAVSRDFSQFRHVHPVMAADGTWTTSIALAAADWRLYADFQPAGGSNRVVDQDFTVRGTPAVVADVGPRTVAEVDGYRVEATGDLVAGGEGTMLEFEVTRGGRPVTDLEPYLGSYGHLVVLRGSDMQYLHVHPEEGPAGPTIKFHVAVPTEGTYHLYLDFKRGGVVRTAAVVLTATAGADDDMGDMGGMDHGGH